MRPALIPHFAEQNDQVTLCFERQKKSYTSCEMRVIDQATQKEVFCTESWETFNRKQIGIRCGERDDEGAFLYILRTEAEKPHRTYHLAESESTRGDDKATYFSARCIRKNDFDIDYGQQVGVPSSKMRIRKCKTKVSPYDSQPTRTFLHPNTELIAWCDGCT